MSVLPERRRFLRGAGIALALPAFESVSRAGVDRTAHPAKRFVCVSPSYGMYPEGFFPRQVGADYEMPGLLNSLEKHRGELSIFSNLDHPDVGGGHGCSNTFLNGVELKDVRDRPQQLLSLDQLLADKLGRESRFPSLQVGSSGISWSRAGTQMPSEADPARLFTRLFVNDSAKMKERTRQHLREDASILDVVREDARALNSKLARVDRLKLDQYLTSVREVERTLQRRDAWVDVDKPRVDDAVIRGSDDDDGLIVDLEYPYNIAVMYDLVVLALQTGLTNVVTMGHPGGNRLFPFEGITLGYHSLTHHGKRPELLRELQVIESFYAEQFSRFLSKMKQAQDAQGRPLLESTLVLFGSGMGNASSHSSRNLPVLLAGGGLQHGQHHRFGREGRDGRPLCDLFVTLIQQLGIQRDRFSSSGGNLNHLLT